MTKTCLSDKKTYEDLNESVKKASDYAKNNIFPNFLSIELFWREPQYLMMLNEEEQIEGEKLSSFMTEIKKKDIQINQPFKVLDGDLQEMPK